MYIDFIIKAFVLSTSLLLISCSHHKINCQPNWKITGFYTPVASDFSNKRNMTIKIKKFKKLTFNKDFVAAVKLEGWGKTQFGWYLGYYGGQWHKENTPLNALGYPLAIGDVAVDRKRITKGTILFIPAIHKLLNVSQFSAVDVGSGVKNQHLDIYAGEGLAAEKLSYQLTGNHQVCFSAHTEAPVDNLTTG